MCVTNIESEVFPGDSAVLSGENLPANIGNARIFVHGSGDPLR